MTQECFSVSQRVCQLLQHRRHLCPCPRRSRPNHSGQRPAWFRSLQEHKAGRLHRELVISVVYNPATHLVSLWSVGAWLGLLTFRPSALIESVRNRH